MKNINSQGFLHIHSLVPIIIVIIAVGAIGSYVYTKSSASSVSKNSAVCSFKVDPAPAKGVTTNYTVKISNNQQNPITDVSVKIGMRASGASGTIVDEITYGTILPDNSKTQSKEIAFPYGSSLNEIYLVGTSSQNSLVNCTESYTVK